MSSLPMTEHSARAVNNPRDSRGAELHTSQMTSAGRAAGFAGPVPDDRVCLYSVADVAFVHTCMLDSHMVSVFYSRGRVTK